MMRLLIAITLLVNNLSAFSQADSLFGVWNNKELSDSTRLRALGSFTFTILQNHPDSCEKLADVGIKLSQKNKLKKQEAYFWNSKGGALLYMGNLPAATKAYHTSINLYEQAGTKPFSIYGNLGTIYFVNKKNEKAIHYFQNALEGAPDDDYNTRAQITHNIGSAYISLAEYKQALIYLRESEQYRVLQKQENLLAVTFNQISVAYLNLNEIDSANFYVYKALKIVDQKDYYSLMFIYLNLADLSLKQKRYIEAINYGKQGLDLAKQSQNITAIEELTHKLSMAYEKSNNIDSAFHYFKEYKIIFDSINNDEAEKKLIEEQLTFEHEKENALQEKEYQSVLLVEKTKQEQQQIIIIMSIISLIGVIIMFRILAKKFKVTKQQKLVIEEKNREITDSIQYAKRIQAAILPPNKIVKEHLPQSFILYKPKDIVAGDFYWMESINSSLEGGLKVGDNHPYNSPQGENIILFAAADCTGHGVPGAMVSVVCNNALNRSVREHGLTDPGKILDKTREIVIEEFEKSEEDVKDGMDIAICSLRFDVQGLKLDKQTSNLKTETAALLQYAGANNPLWIITNCQSELVEDSNNSEVSILRQAQDDTPTLLEIKANKQPIGKYDNPTPYTTHTIKLQKGDTFYVFSDGYVDQFGGEKGKKFKSVAFKKLLLDIQSESMDKQKQLIDDAFEQWKGNLEQIDDVCIIGVRI